MELTKITICGGGNGAQTLLPIAAHNLNCDVDLYAPFGDEAQRLAAGIASHGGLQATGAVQAMAQPRRVSADPAEVIPGSQIVVLVLPAFAHEATLRQIAPFLDQGAWVGAIPARGGFDYCAAWVLARLGRPDVGLFGLQTLPWACRIEAYGQAVHVLGVKEAVDAASRPAAQIGEIRPILERMLGLRVDAAASLLALTLANTGQIIHPGIMYGLFADWDGTAFDRDEVPLFYQGLTEAGAETLAALSDDVQAIRARLQGSLDLAAVRPLDAWLQHCYSQAIADASCLRSAFVTNRAYAGLKAPVREVTPGRCVPDFSARYLAEDVPFGLAVSRAIAQLAGVGTPAMDRVIAWTGEKLGKDYLGRDVILARIPQKYGLDSLERLLAFAHETLEIGD
ncbi:MAG: NAD/NADP octopine/nopaline dehydrogenase family protein [Anaerolineae bacterium]